MFENEQLTGIWAPVPLLGPDTPMSFRNDLFASRKHAISRRAHYGNGTEQDMDKQFWSMETADQITSLQPMVYLHENCVSVMDEAGLPMDPQAIQRGDKIKVWYHVRSYSNSKCSKVGFKAFAVAVQVVTKGFEFQASKKAKMEMPEFSSPGKKKAKPSFIIGTQDQK